MIPRGLVYAGLLILGGLVLLGCHTNPVTGASELSFYSPTEELALGDEMHPRVIYQYDGEYNDPELKRYLGTIVGTPSSMRKSVNPGHSWTMRRAPFCVM